jgi:hypothetical protein
VGFSFELINNDLERRRGVEEIGASRGRAGCAAAETMGEKSVKKNLALGDVLRR